MAKSSKPRRRAALTQDPHAVREFSTKDLEAAIGYEVRRLRNRLGITIVDLASAANLSSGMLSKIENGAISASLTTLQQLSRALNVPLTALFKGLETTKAAVHVPSDSGLEIERRGTRAGHQYRLLGHLDASTTDTMVEPYLITLTAESDTFKTFQHEGLEFIYMLEGEVRYRHGDRLFTLKPGDSLFFDADAPHGPEALIGLPAKYLAIISYPRSG
jgi:transcriptional regulator with XRE-family HTH domain